MIEPRERLIFALDVPTADAALGWVDRLGEVVGFYKVGMELLTSGAYFEVIEELARRGKKIFVDLKFLDVPATVAHAVKGLTRYPIDLCTIHAQHAAMMQAAASEKGAMRLLGVTVLTSMDGHDLQALGIQRTPAEQVLDRALAARAAGLDGVVASGHEAEMIRVATGPEFLIVCPGIRPDGPSGDDQKRVMGVGEAFRGGASHIVVGRPIRSAPDPAAAAAAIVTQIEQALDMNQ